MNPITTEEKQPQAKAAAMNPLLGLQEQGQSVWLDYIRRHLITSGELKQLIDNDGLRGITSNPSIFEKAIAGSTDYTDMLQELRAQNLSAGDIYERIAIRDIQDAADLLRPVYDATNRRDGYVSLEVSPTLARKTQESIDEARRLWKAVGRENVMIKIPGTDEGAPAVRQLTSEGININITLLFAQNAYEKVAEAFMAGLEDRVKKGQDISKLASVASFFVSRIDSLADSTMQNKLKTETDPQKKQLLTSLLGKVAIANARQAYRTYEQIIAGERWKALAAKGAQTQRLLWASTSTKNPSYRDVLYVEELIGPDTVNTIPPATMDAFRDHGKVARTIGHDLPAADKIMTDLEKAGISMQQITNQLLDEAIKLFAEAFQKLIAAVAAKKDSSHSDGLATKAKIETQSAALPPPLQQAVDATIKDWVTNNKVNRLWKCDKSLWTNDDENKWLGWLNIATESAKDLAKLDDLAAFVKSSGFTHVLLLGMGGSSLCPEVLALTFGNQNGFPQLHILDSDDPAQVKTVEKQIDPAKTLFIVASKSGSTLEPNIFKQYFFAVAEKALGKGNAGKSFVAITDPGSKMEQVAQADKFQYIFHGLPSIGGRYSALSNFGLVPAAAMGLDVRRFLERTSVMVEACAATVSADKNPGAMLGAILGTLGNEGRNKVTIVTTPRIYDLGAWLEQLIAESTGKLGKGLIPVDREKLGTPDVYGNDRIFVYLRLAGDDNSQQAKLDALQKAGQPVVTIDLADIYDIGQEFFRWEIATAVAGSILGINAFNQPDVEASKIATRQITNEFEKTGKLPAETPFFEADGIKLFTDARNAQNLNKLAGSKTDLAAILRAHLGQLTAGDYFALLAYVEMNRDHENALQTIRHAVRDKKHVATCLGFGPRFLHSTGQAYKGGPNSGVFLQLTCDDAADLPVPDQKYTFGVVKAAQAIGDFQVLAERGRRALRVHLPKDVNAGLQKLGRAIEAALA
jgi:transaldolase / glucose-6-phosphate isomerase